MPNLQDGTLLQSKDASISQYMLPQDVCFILVRLYFEPLLTHGLPKGAILALNGCILWDQRLVRHAGKCFESWLS